MWIEFRVQKNQWTKNRIVRWRKMKYQVKRIVKNQSYESKVIPDKHCYKADLICMDCLALNTVHDRRFNI